MERIKVIFLDIDGVLNSQRFYESMEKQKRLEFHDKYGESFDELSSSLLNKLITETGAKVVVSSTWRHQGLDAMKQMWIDRGMKGEVIAITPDFRFFKTTSRNGIDDYDVTIPRGLEIEWYYETIHNFRHWNWDGPYVQEQKAKCTLDTYVIFDDDSDMLYQQKDNFVHCTNMNGLTEVEYEKAYKILMKVE